MDLHFTPVLKGEFVNTPWLTCTTRQLSKHVLLITIPSQRFYSLFFYKEYCNEFDRKLQVVS